MSESAMNPEAQDDEQTDAEIIREIEMEEKEMERQRLEMIRNGSLPNATADEAFTTPREQQLTRFQENIITTGSGVSIFLLALLAILFVVQAARKAYKAFTTSRALEKVGSALDEGHETRAEEINPFSDIDPKSYPVYNTSFDARDAYYDKMDSGASPQVLKDLLLQRAIVCIDRFTTIQRDGPGIRKNWELDMLPKEVWDDFNAAQANVQYEINQVLEENDKHKHVWGRHQNDIFAQGREVYGQYVTQKRNDFQQRMMRQRMGQERHARGSGGNKAPSPSRFGSGLQRGFLNQGSGGAQGPQGGQEGQQKLSRRQKKKQKKQQERARQNGMVYEGQSAVGGAAENTDSQQQLRRRKKGRRRFGKS